MNNNRQLTYLLSFCLLMLTLDAWAASDRGRFLGGNFSIQANAITHLNLPIEQLKGSQLSTHQGMRIEFKDKGSINIDTLTQESLNLPSNDLSNLPLYLMGIKNLKKNSPDAEVIQQKIIETKKAYQPIKMASFRTPNGDGYLMVGNKQSVIFLTDRDDKTLITKIHIDTMSESDINNLLIKGLI